MPFTFSKLSPLFGLAVLVFVLFTNCQCQTGNSNGTNTEGPLLTDFQYDSELYERVMRLMTLEPHPLGSARQKAVAAEIKAEAEKLGLSSYLQPFTATTPNPSATSEGGPQALTLDLEGMNVVASFSDTPQNCYFVFGSHFDTKIINSGIYVGANDSGSSTVALLHIAKYLSEHQDILHQLRCAPLFVWFDGEEAVLDGWSDGENIHPARIQDNTYGSRYFVSNLTDCDGQHCYNDQRSSKKVDSLILLDLVGTPNLRFSNDSYSTNDLKSKFISVLNANGLSEKWTRSPKYIEDDHIPFLAKGIPAIDLIDFEDLTHWHKHTDLPETVSAESVGLAAKLALELALSL